MTAAITQDRYPIHRRAAEQYRQQSAHGGCNSLLVTAPLPGAATPGLPVLARVRCEEHKSPETPIVLEADSWT